MLRDESHLEINFSWSFSSVIETRLNIPEPQDITYIIGFRTYRNEWSFNNWSWRVVIPKVDVTFTVRVLQKTNEQFFKDCEADISSLVAVKWHRKHNGCPTFFEIDDGTLWCLIDVPPLINVSKFFQPGHSYSNPGYYILGKIPSNTSFQDIYSFCIDENKKILLKSKKSILNLGESSNPPVYSNHPPPC